MRKILVFIFTILFILPAVFVQPVKAQGNLEENIAAIKDREGYKKFDFQLSNEEIENSEYIILEETHIFYPETENKTILEFNVINNEFRQMDFYGTPIRSVDDFPKVVEKGYRYGGKEITKTKIDFPKYRRFTTSYKYGSGPEDIVDVFIGIFDGRFNDEGNKLSGDSFGFKLYPDSSEFTSEYNKLELYKTDCEDFYYNPKNDPCIGEWYPKETYFITDTYTYTDYLNLEDEFNVYKQNPVSARISIRHVDDISKGGTPKSDSSGGNTGGNIGGGDINPLVDGLLPFIGSLISILGLLGLSSGISGLGSSGFSNTSGENTDGKEDDNNEGSLILDADIRGGTLIAGDIEKSVTIVASIEGDAEEELKKQAAKYITISPASGALGAEHVYIEEEREESDYKIYYVSFTYIASSEFYEGDTGLNFPIEIPLMVNCSYPGVRPKKLSLKVSKGEEKLIIRPKSIVIADRAKRHEPIKVKVKSMENKNWTFIAEVMPALENAIKAVECVSENNKSCNISITPQILPEGAGMSVSNTILIKAIDEENKKNLEGRLPVTVAREGLIVVNEQPLTIVADGITNSNLKFGAVTSSYDELTTDYDLLSNLKIDSKIVTEDKISANAFETAGLEFSDGEWGNFEGYKNDTLSTYTYNIKTKKSIPGKGVNYRGKLSVSASKGDVFYKVEIPLILDVLSMGPGSPKWQKELKDCRTIIKMIPKEYQPKMNSILESKSKVMGAQGLYELRKKIWKIGLTLWEADGAKGYEDVERWAGYIEDTLNVAHWLGRMAADIAGTMVTGSPFLGIVIGESHDAIVSALVAYRDGLDLEEWYDKYFYGDLMDMIEGLGQEALSPERIIKYLSKFFKKNPKMKVAAYSMLFIYNFTVNICRRDMNAIDAAKAAVKDLVYAEVLKFAAGKITKHTKKGANTKGTSKGNSSFTDPMTNQKGYLNAKQKINDLYDAIESGDPKAIEKSVYDLKTDKYAIAEINKKIDGKSLYPDSLKNKVECVYDDMVKKPVNDKLNKKIKDFYSNKKNVSKILDIEDTGRSNPTKHAKVGSDWDVGKKVKYIDGNGNYRTEIMKAKDMKPLLTDSINETIGDKYGKGISAEDLRMKNDIEPMGKDAAGGFSDDVEKAIGIKNNKELYYDKSIGIKDPQGFGNTSKHKVLEWWNEKAQHLSKNGSDLAEINSSKLEGLKQYNKQYNTLLKPMEDIAKIKKPNLKAPPKVLEQFQNLTNEVINGHKSIEYMEETLKNSGYSVEKILDIFGSHIETYAKEL